MSENPKSCQGVAKIQEEKLSDIAISVVKTLRDKLQDS